LLTCAHYPNCDHIIIDTTNTKSISPDIQHFGKSLSAPNLTIDSDFYVNNSINKSDVSDGQKSVTSTISDSSNTFDEIESLRTNPFDRLHEIDWFNSNACVTDSNHAINEVKTSNSLLPINNVITSEFCQHSLTGEQNCIRDSVVLRENVSTMSTNSLHERNETNTQIEDKQIDAMEQTVVLNDYFDSDKCEDNSEKPPLLSDRKSIVCSRNSRLRPVVTDKRLRNVVLDRLKRLAVSQIFVVLLNFLCVCLVYFTLTYFLQRSQSHGRSDGTSTANFGSRALVLRTKGLYRNVKRRFSSAHTCVDEKTANISIDDSCLTSCSKININRMESTALHDSIDTSTVTLRHCSSFESIEDSGCGSSKTLA
jgi:hypothetical protein